MVIHLKILRAPLLAACLAATMAAAAFVAPEEGKAPFRRDQLPIDTDAMSRLSRELSILSQTARLDTAENRRAAAQALAVAIALDPANATARSQISLIEDAGALPQPPDDELAKAKAFIWQLNAWLATPEAGEDGNSLGAVISDAVSWLDPEHPMAIELRQKPELGEWAGWVAPLNDFAEKPSDASPGAADSPVEVPVIAAKNASPAPEPSAIPLKQAALTAVLPRGPKGSGPIGIKGYYPTAVTMTSKTGGGEIHVSIPGPDESAKDIEGTVAKPIGAALKKAFPGNAAAGTITLAVGNRGSYQFSLGRDDLTAPGFVLAAAAISGTDVDGTVIGRIDAGGKLALPLYFWRTLSHLDDGPGGRLILPAAAGEYLTALLTMEMPEFFLKYEVLLAGSSEEMVALSAKKPSEEIGKAFEGFRSIAEKSSDTPSLGTYLANRFIRQRLEEIAAAAPWHLSARLLAKQGSGERARVVPRKIVAAEVWQAIDGMRAAITVDIPSINPPDLKEMAATYEAARAAIDRMERYTDNTDKDLIEKGRDLASDFRGYTRLLGARGELYERLGGLLEARSALQLAHSRLRSQLAEITGDPLPETFDATGKIPPPVEEE